MFTIILFLMMPVTGCGGEMIQPKKEYSVAVFFPADEAGLEDSFMVDQDGKAELTMESSEQNPDLFSIGYYTMDIGSKKADDLKKKLDRIQRSGIPAGDMAPPGTQMVRVKIIEDGKETVLTIDPGTSAPTMCALADEARDIADETARKGSMKVVTMTVELEATDLAQGELLNCSIVLESTGKKDVSVVHPLESGGDKTQTGQFTLWAVRSDLPVEELWPHHSVHSQLMPLELVEKKIPLQDAEGIINLPPAHTAEFKFSHTTDWEPGTYEVKIIFETLGTSADLLKGKIISKPLTLKITEKK